jgi:hypothetical protein
MADSLLVFRVRPPEGYEDRQRYLPLCQIAARFFPGVRLVGEVVLDIVEQLEGDAELQTEGFEGKNVIGARAGKDTAQLAGHGEERGCLLLDDLHAGPCGESEVPMILKFHHLTLYELYQGFHGKGGDGGVLRPEGKIHDRGQKKVACKDGDAIPPEAVDGGPMATDSRTIHDVVMKKGSVVEGLHQGCSFGKMRGCVAEQSSGQAEEVGAKALPLGLKDKADDRVQPTAGRMDSVENLVCGERGHDNRVSGFCGLLLGKHRSSLFPSCCCLRFAEESGKKGANRTKSHFLDDGWPNPLSLSRGSRRRMCTVRGGLPTWGEGREGVPLKIRCRSGFASMVHAPQAGCVGIFTERE